MNATYFHGFCLRVCFRLRGSHSEGSFSPPRISTFDDVRLKRPRSLEVLGRYGVRHVGILICGIQSALSSWKR